MIQKQSEEKDDDETDADRKQDDTKKKVSGAFKYRNLVFSLTLCQLILVKHR